jgi:uncharacterized protein YkwD
VIATLNADRSANGLAPLAGNGALTGIAQGWANWMAENQSLAHQNLGVAIGRTGFSTMAENILSGDGGMTAGDVERVWMASPAHRANIVSGAYTAAGVGVAYSADGRVWAVVDFGG